MPAEHWSKLRGTNPLGPGQRRDRPALGRRRHLPNDAALLRLATSLLIEQDDDWLVGRRHLSGGSMALALGRRRDAQVPALTAEVP